VEFPKYRHGACGIISGCRSRRPLFDDLNPQWTLRCFADSSDLRTTGTNLSVQRVLYILRSNIFSAAAPELCPLDCGQCFFEQVDVTCGAALFITQLLSTNLTGIPPLLFCLRLRVTMRPPPRVRANGESWRGGRNIRSA